MLQAPNSGKHPEVTDLYSRLSVRQGETLQLVPFYCDVPENEKVDTLAKVGREYQQPDKEVS